MTSATELAEALTLLGQCMLADPIQGLATIISWLDPLYGHPAADIPSYNRFDFDEMLVAGTVCRECFPAVYQEWVSRARRGESTHQLEQYLCGAISQQLGVELESLELIPYGLPLNTQGVNLLDPDLCTVDELQIFRPLLACFGIEQERLGDRAAYHQAQQIGMVLMESLLAHNQDTYTQLAYALGWMLSIIGNTLVDYVEGELWEMGLQPLAWTPEDIAWHRAIHQEADEILALAKQGLDLIQTDLTLRQALQQNIHRIAPQLPQERNDYGFTNTDIQRLSRQCRWPGDTPELAGSPAGTATQIL